jgi:hypothetical protein
MLLNAVSAVPALAEKRQAVRGLALPLLSLVAALTLRAGVPCVAAADSLSDGLVEGADA